MTSQFTTSGSQRKYHCTGSGQSSYCNVDQACNIKTGWCTKHNDLNDPAFSFYCPLNDGSEKICKMNEICDATEGCISLQQYTSTKNVAFAQVAGASVPPATSVAPPPATPVAPPPATPVAPPPVVPAPAPGVCKTVTYEGEVYSNSYCD